MLEGSKKGKEDDRGATRSNYNSVSLLDPDFPLTPFWTWFKKKITKYFLSDIKKQMICNS